MRAKILSLSLLVVATLIYIAQASAQSADDRSDVRLDGRALFQVGASGGTNSSDRARRIERRLSALVEAETRPASVATVQRTGETANILMSGVTLMTVTQEDAEDNVTSLQQLAERWAGFIDSALKRARERRDAFGGRFLAEIRSSIEAAFGRLLESIIRIVPRALAALLVIALFWALARLVRWAMRAFFKRFVEDETTESLIKQVVYYAVVAVGVIVAVDALGFEPQTVVTGLGLTGLALGFALKDIISNFVSGVLILSLRPFDLGDQIVVGQTEGSVERIELRATQIRTYDGRVALVPNADVFTGRIINNTAHPIRRGTVTVMLNYDDDLERAIRTLLAAGSQADGVSNEQNVAVRVSELGENIVLDLSFWTDSRRSDFNDTCSHVRQAIVGAFKAEGIGLPDPDRRVIEQRVPARRDD